ARLGVPRGTLKRQHLRVDERMDASVDSVIPACRFDSELAPGMAFPCPPAELVEHSRDHVIAVARRHLADDVEIGAGGAGYRLCARLLTRRARVAAALPVLDEREPAWRICCVEYPRNVGAHVPRVELDGARGVIPDTREGLPERDQRLALLRRDW